MGRRSLSEARLRITPPIVATVAASIAVFIATLLPWLRTGEARRSAYGLARSAQTLGLFEGWSRRVMLGLLFGVPLLVAATWTAGALRRPGLVAAFGGLVGATSVAAGAVVHATVPGQIGPVVGITAGAVALVSSSWLAAAIVQDRAEPIRHIDETKEGEPDERP